MSLTRNYRPAVDAFLVVVRDHFQAHGTDLIDILIAHYPGNGAASDSAGDLLRQMVAEGLVVRNVRPAPTLSQRAFDSLSPGDAAERYFKGPTSASKAACSASSLDE